MNKNRVKEMVKILKSLGNDNRVRILYYLQNQEKNVGELQALLGLSQSALSQHLAVLRRAKIVKTRRAAQTIYYSVGNAKVIQILKILDENLI